MSQRGGRRARALRAPAHAMTACAPAQQRLLAGVGRGRGMPIVRRLAVDVTDKYWSDTLRMHGFSPTRPSAFLLEVPPPPLFVLIGHAASLTPYNCFSAALWARPPLPDSLLGPPQDSTQDPTLEAPGTKMLKPRPNCSNTDGRAPRSADRAGLGRGTPLRRARGHHVLVISRFSPGAGPLGTSRRWDRRFLRGPCRDAVPRCRPVLRAWG